MRIAGPMLSTSVRSTLFRPGVMYSTAGPKKNLRPQQKNKTANDVFNLFNPAPSADKILLSNSDNLVSRAAVSTEMDAKYFSNIPRTGIKAGRSVEVNSASGLGQALRTLRIVNMSNNVPRTLSLQRYHERRCKTKRRLKIEKSQRDFKMGIKRLFKLVEEARRKGY